ncbi:ABC transporter ATP-binding protein [Cupriavidus sp. CuC1]|uniref:ABC transporter ATP-binding protein n=1 Tax=Cupriavidus sp. CuC1 TaxID=3373131 RepID=UPI0037CF5706
MSTLLAVRNVTKRFGGVVANRAISLQIPRGEIVGLIGPNGSGKTTLFNSIAGNHSIDDGSVLFDGKEISHLRVAEIARLGIARTFQQTRVFANMNCLQNLLVSVPRGHEGLAALCRRPPASVMARARDCLRFAGLQAREPDRAGNLSFGQQKLLELAMALMNEPSLLLLDEPTAGINPVMIHGMVDLLRRIQAQRGIALLVIEHNMQVIQGLASYVYCLANGALLAEGPPERILADRSVIEAYLGV